MTARVLIVDDDPAMGDMLAARLARRGYAPDARRDAAAAFEALRARDYDVVVTDLRMAGDDGLALCARVIADREDLPVIVITAFGSLETAVAAIRAGAYDFVSKPFELEALVAAIERAVQHRRLRGEVKRLGGELRGARAPAGMIGASAPMREVHELVERVAAADATVLVTGESGTGKELIARALHAGSPRRGGPFVAVNCAALPEALLESELFGHVRGAFTDARTSRAGLFAQAGGGSLFLDEIGELPLALQPKLLRALQDRVVRPVGGDREVPVDVRVIAATNRELGALVGARAFREDLYYRLDVIRIELPPLRVRGEDVLELAQHFLRRACHRTGKPIDGFSRAAAARLLAYPWPGNVRELQNCVERAVALARYAMISVEDLPERVRAHAGPPPASAGGDPAELPSMEEVERRHIARVLAAVGGNKASAARILGYDRTTLYRKLERYRLLDP